MISNKTLVELQKKALMTLIVSLRGLLTRLVEMLDQQQQYNESSMALKDFFRVTTTITTTTTSRIRYIFILEQS